MSADVKVDRKHFFAHAWYPNKSQGFKTSKYLDRKFVYR